MKRKTRYKSYRKKRGIPWLALGILLIIALAAGSQLPDTNLPGSDQITAMQSEAQQFESEVDQNEESPDDAESGDSTAESLIQENISSGTQAVSDEAISDADIQIPPFSAADIPACTVMPSVIINYNKPYFQTDEQHLASFECYSPLDQLGRCGTAYANIGQDLMPEEERGSIGNVRPSGWHTVKYSDLIEDNYLYNRCHLLAYALTGENDNVCNLITGTRYMNVQGMLPYEEKVIGYIRRTGNHVLMRVTPVFDGDDLVARGVLMEAYSREDDGRGICFNAFCYNVQPGIIINYADGSSQADPDAVPINGSGSGSDRDRNKWGEPIYQQSSAEVTYVLNTRSMKFHKPDCKSVKDMKAINRQETKLTRDELIKQGYSPCGSCNP